MALVFVLLLMRMAGRQDRAARHAEKRLDPFSDVTITRLGSRSVDTATGDGTAREEPPRTPDAAHTSRRSDDQPHDSR